MLPESAESPQGEGTEHDAKSAILAGGYATGLPGKLISDVVLGTNAWLHGDAGAPPWCWGRRTKRSSGNEGESWG